MPFIDAKVSVALTKEKKEKLKEKLGQAITCIPGKSESWLMVGLTDSCELYFQGNQNGPTGFVDVKIFGSAPDEAYEKMTAELGEIFEEELGIPKDRLYVTYQTISQWGWNGGNF